MLIDERFDAIMREKFPFFLVKANVLLLDLVDANLDQIKFTENWPDSFYLDNKHIVGASSRDRLKLTSNTDNISVELRIFNGGKEMFYLEQPGGDLQNFAWTHKESDPAKLVMSFYSTTMTDLYPEDYDLNPDISAFEARVRTLYNLIKERG